MSENTEQLFKDLYIKERNLKYFAKLARSNMWDYETVLNLQNEVIKIKRSLRRSNLTSEYENYKKRQQQKGITLAIRDSQFNLIFEE